jgi:hypothetical protein
MEDEMPNTILVIVVTLIILAIGIFAFYFVYGSIGYEVRQTEYFDVSDPSSDVIVTLSHFPRTIISVYQYNGYDWIEVPSIYYSNNIKEVTIDKDGLQG